MDEFDIRGKCKPRYLPDRYNATQYTVLMTCICHARGKVCIPSEQRCRDNFMVLHGIFQRSVDAKQTKLLREQLTVSVSRNA